MGESQILRDVLIIFLVSISVVYVFQKFQLPSIAGFLVAGTLVGPHGLNVISDRGQIETLAEVGVMLLLFTIGLEFSLTHLKTSRRLLLLSGPLQVGGTLGLTVAVGMAIGLSVEEAIFWGLLLSLSSTAIVLKALADRGETDSYHGRSTIGILIFQDLAVVPMILITPLLGMHTPGTPTDLVMALAQSALVVVLIIVTAWFVAPWILDHIVRTKSRELFLLTIIVMGLGTAWVVSMAGLSLALGAFIAGLLISESRYSHQALAEVLPFRDTFNSLFFVSIGMLLDVRVLLMFPVLITAVVMAVLVGKFLTSAIAVIAGGAPIRTGILVGMALAQVGEFSFILAQEGQQAGLLNTHTYNIFLSVSVLTMIITPFLISISPKCARRAEAFQWLHHWWEQSRARTLTNEPPVKIRDHVIIVGYGLNGRNLARVLREVEIPYLVLEISADLVEAGHKAGVPILYGDATNVTVLKHACIENARVMVIATSDPFGARRMVQLARSLNPHIHIIVRTRYLKELEELHDLGANEVVPEEFETSIEIFALVLRTYKLPQSVIVEKAEQIRREGYAILRRGEVLDLAHHLRRGTLADVEVETCRIDEDSPAVGKSLSDVGIYFRTGATVIALTRAGTTRSNPPSDTVLEVGDVLVLMGSRDQIRRALALLIDTEGRADRAQAASQPG